MNKNRLVSKGNTFSKVSEDKSEPDITEDERILVDLIMGARNPKNDYEKTLLEQIKDIKNKGLTADIPFDI